MPDARASPNQDGNRPSRRRQVGVGLVLTVLAAGFMLLGYAWTRSPGPPPSPDLCLRHGGNTCYEETSGAYVWTSDPNVPISVTGSFATLPFQPGHYGEAISIGADLPAHRALEWMVQLIGGAKLVPEEFGPDMLGGRWHVLLPKGATLRTVEVPGPARANTLPTAQIIEGAITGPANGYSTMKTAIYDSNVGIYSSSTGGIGDNLGTVEIQGATFQPVVTENAAYLAADLPFVEVGNFDSTPGSTLLANSYQEGACVPGSWYSPKSALVSVSFDAEPDMQMIWSYPAASDSPPNSPSDVQWLDLRAVAASVTMRNLATQTADQNRQFWAGIALGVGGGAFVGAVQLLLLIPIRRERKAKRKRPSAAAS